MGLQIWNKRPNYQNFYFLLWQPFYDFYGIRPYANSVPTTWQAFRDTWYSHLFIYLTTFILCCCYYAHVSRDSECPICNMFSKFRGFWTSIYWNRKQLIASWHRTSEKIHIITNRRGLYQATYRLGYLELGVEGLKVKYGAKWFLHYGPKCNLYKCVFEQWRTIGYKKIRHLGLLK